MHSTDLCFKFNFGMFLSCFGFKSHEDIRSVKKKNSAGFEVGFEV